MSNVIDDDNYVSEDDEDYQLPVDAPAENENDAFLIKKDEEKAAENNGSGRDADDLWAEFLSDTAAPTTNGGSNSDSSDLDKNGDADSNHNNTHSVDPECSKSNLPASIAQSSPATKASKRASASGFDAILGGLRKKQKMSVLDRSKADWDQHVKKESMKEELESHIKSKDSYLDKQDFLARADFNKFQKERDFRESNRRRL